MPNPFASNVNQGIVDQAQNDQLLNAAMQGDPNATAQLEAVIQQRNPQGYQAWLNQKNYAGQYGVTPDTLKRTLSKIYLQTTSGNANSPVYYDPQSGGYQDQTKDSALFKVAQFAPGAVGGGLALAGMGAAGAGMGADPAAEGATSAIGSGGGVVGTAATEPEVGGMFGGGPLWDTAGAAGAATNPVTAASGWGKIFSPANLANWGLNLGGAALGSHAAGKAAGQEEAAARNALGLQTDIYNRGVAAYMPYYQMGAGSLGRLRSFVGTPNAPALPPIQPGSLSSLGK